MGKMLCRYCGSLDLVGAALSHHATSVEHQALISGAMLRAG